jgi:hypothetical protein
MDVMSGLKRMSLGECGEASGKPLVGTTGNPQASHLGTHTVAGSPPLGIS